MRLNPPRWSQIISMGFTVSALCQALEALTKGLLPTTTNLSRVQCGSSGYAYRVNLGGSTMMTWIWLMEIIILTFYSHINKSASWWYCYNDMVDFWWYSHHVCLISIVGGGYGPSENLGARPRAAAKHCQNNALIMKQQYIIFRKPLRGLMMAYFEAIGCDWYSSRLIPSGNQTLQQERPYRWTLSYVVMGKQKALPCLISEG